MIRNKKYIVELSPEETKYLKKLIKSGKEKARKILRANVLLKANHIGPQWTDKQISDAFSISIRGVEGIRKKLVLEGFESALNRKKHVGKILRKKIDGSQEAKLIALVMSDPPKGRDRWTLRLLTKRLVELEIVEDVSYETVRKTLKKIDLSLGTKNRG